jgi:hypothetical protein
VQHYDRLTALADFSLVEIVVTEPVQVVKTTLEGIQ